VAADGPARPAWPPLAGAAGFVVLATALQMVRRPSGPPLWDSLFVEDGEIFLAQALTTSVRETLFASYQGYLHVVPRAIAEVAAELPLERAPLAMSLMTTTLVALLAVFVYVGSGAWIASRLLRGAIAVAFVYVPVAALDMNGVESYVSWYFLYASFWALAAPWTDRGWIAAAALVVLLTALGNPLVALLAPVGLVTAARMRRPRAWVVTATLGAGLLVQLLLRDGTTESFTSSNPAEVPRSFAERVTSSLLVGERFLEPLFGGRTGSPFAWASLVVVAAACGLGLWRLRGRRRWLLGACAALAVVMFCLPVLIRGTENLYPPMPWLGLGSRYVYLPVMLLLTGLLAAVDRPRFSPERRPRAREALAAALVLAVIALNLPVEHHAVGGPRWSAGLDAARAQCRALPPEPQRTVIVPIAPATRPGQPRGPFTWEVPLRCAGLGA
jgi:hypothetical protein